MKKTSLIIFTLFLFISLLLATENGDQLVKSLQNKFNSISYLTADFRQTSNGRVTLAGKFFYGKGNKMRLELKSLIIVTDGKTNWSYNKKDKKVVISNYDPSDPSIISLERIIKDYPSSCKVTTEKEGSTDVINLSPNKRGLNFKNAKIHINSENLIEKINMVDQNNNQVQIEFSNYQLNKDLGASTFTFTPPKGSKVIDLR
jgi:outer membrane lipoprotein carrier protein